MQEGDAGTKSLYIPPIRPLSRKASQLVSRMVRWLGVIHANIEPGMRRYFEWPTERAEEVRRYYLRKRALAEA
jgi:hypothetical protein